MGYEVVKEFAEKISGAKKVAEREALTELLSFVEANHIDKVLIYKVCLGMLLVIALAQTNGKRRLYYCL